MIFWLFFIYCSNKKCKFCIRICKLDFQALKLEKNNELTFLKFNYKILHNIRRENLHEIYRKIINKKFWLDNYKNYGKNVRHFCSRNKEHEFGFCNDPIILTRFRVLYTSRYLQKQTFRFGWLRFNSFMKISLPLDRASIKGVKFWKRWKTASRTPEFLLVIIKFTILTRKSKMYNLNIQTGIRPYKINNVISLMIQLWKSSSNKYINLMKNKYCSYFLVFAWNMNVSSDFIFTNGKTGNRFPPLW